MTTYDIGDQVLVELEVFDPDGARIDASTVSLAVTAPDGTPSAPSASNVSTGLYRASVPVDQAGGWSYVWTTTGPAGVEHGQFTVAADPPDRLPPLATIEDLEARIGDLTDAQAARAPGLLRGASAKVRAFARHQQLTRVDNDVMVLRSAGHRIRLPQRPVIDVTSVVLIDGDTDLTLNDWSWDGLDDIDLRGSRIADGSSRSARQHNTSTYRVTNSHGFDPGHPLLEAVADVICTMVNRTLTSPTKVDGATQQVIGQYSVQFQQGTGSSGVGVRLYESDKRDLIEAGVRRVATSVKTRVR
ncbi:MAG: hypothetical protein AAGE88_18185 [Actinomycetota bacterium]